MNTNISISRQVALECVATFCERTGKTIKAESIKPLTDKLTKWILSKGEEKDTLICRQAALKRACLFCGVHEPHIDTSDDLLAKAEELYKLITL